MRDGSMGGSPKEAPPLARPLRTGTQATADLLALGECLIIVFVHVLIPICILIPRRDRDI